VTGEASTPAARSGETDERGTRRAVLSQLGSPDVLLLAGGLVLPNLLSFATLISLLDIGLPPRTCAIVLYASLAILARRIPFALTAALFLCLLAFDMVQTLSLMFGLAPTEMTAALDEARRIHFFASPLYLSLIAVMLTTTLAALACLSRRSALVHGRASILFVLALAFGALDYASNVSPQYSFGSTFGRDKPVESAAEVSGFSLAAGAHGNNVVVVIVESLGYLLDQTARERIAAPLYDPAITNDYLVTSGHTVYYGATTSGEMRELCNTRTFYADYVQKNGSSCLPSLLKSRGYTSIALHAFSGGMFDREQWYPEIGFDKELFGEEIVKTTHRSCGAGFHGACDADFAPIIADASRQAAQTGKPRFIYWLTLNTHIPVAPDEALIDFHCTLDNNGFGLPRVCRMAELWHDVFTVAARIARDPAVGPADILMVGDHAPPLWSKRGRAEFAPGQVAWYRLQPRRDAAGVPRSDTVSHAN
jgi:hypothetical protein